MKYIDADLLRKEIEKRLKNIRDYMSGTGMRYKGPKYFKAQGKESAYDALLSIIVSLQQEQQESPSLVEKAIVWFNNIAESAKRLSAGNVSHLGPTIAGMAIRSEEFLEKHKQEQPEQPTRGYDEAYLNDCIANVKKGRRMTEPVWKRAIEEEVNGGKEPRLL